MKRIPAFTMIELIVVMILSSVVIALTYSLFATTEKSVAMASGRNDRTNRVLQLQGLLNDDCNKASLVYYENNELKVERVDHRIIIYKLLPGKIIRNEEVYADTFRIGPFETSASYLFDNPPLLEKLVIEVQGSGMMPLRINEQIIYPERIRFQHRESEIFNNQKNGN
jgi:prepilin-type N-terminal cleavage/methylation domain-containing protein